MKNFWSVLLLTVILQSLALSILAGHHGHHGSNLAHILAAGLIVQLLARQGGDGGGEGKHSSGRHSAGHYSGRSAHAGYTPYGSWYEESRMTPESSLANSAWAQRAPLDISYAQSSYQEPAVETYNTPYYDMPYHNLQPPINPGIW